MSDDADLVRLAARGALTGAVATELAGPLARATETLGQLVDRLDTHVAHARGPEPLSWAAVGELRQRLADLFLEVGRMRRLAVDLALVAVARDTRHAEAVDANELVERALLLSRHRFRDDQDVFVDLGTLPAVDADPIRFVQALAHLLMQAAAAAGPGATITVSTDPGAAIVVTFPGHLESTRFSAFVDSELEAEGGGFSYTEDSGVTTARVTLRVAK